MKDVFQDVVDFLGNYSEIDPKTVEPGTRLKEDLGLSSLTLIMMVEQAERKFGISIRDDQLITLRSVGDIVKCVEAQQR